MKKSDYRIKTKVKSANWKLPVGLLSLKLFTYWALTMGDWLVKIS